MYLKRMEMIGFKSFAKKVVIDFTAGVNGVVGPNGSGKSNIIDAVRWVLGEHSAKSLRGTKMEDVIFGGSQTHKPLNFAEVSLVLDNANRALPLDFEEISITRRVYRTGESAYLINGRVCRLKDITELMLDSRLGKESFSIISQGKVEEVLSSKPEDRRSVFEEAAGVLKYKHRKRQASMKLEKAEENLQRIDDILYELSHSLGPLQEQSEEAKRYTALKELYDRFEIAHYTTSIERYYTEWESSKQTLALLKESSQAVLTTLTREEATYENDRFQMNEQDKQIELLQQTLMQQQESRDAKRASVQLTEQKVKMLREEEAKQRDRLQRNEVQTAATKVKLSEKEAERGRIVDEVSKQEAVIRDLEQKLHTLNDALVGDQRTVERDYEAAKLEHTRERERYVSETEAILRMREELAQLQVEKDSILAQERSLSENCDVLRTEEQTSLKTHALLEQELANARLHIREQTEERDAIRVRHTNVTRELATLEARKRTMEETIDRFEGFYAGVRHVLKGKSLAGIHGAISQLITVPQQFERAIEQALGASAQHVITETENDAAQAIEWLKRERLGRATFLPLDRIRGREVPQDVLQRAQRVEGFLGVAV
ncbi:MAG: chromosome segregation SMC family protein, partial [Bacilli bacterium]